VTGGSQSSKPRTPIGVPLAALVAGGDFGAQLPASRVAAALARGIERAGGCPPDVLALPAEGLSPGFVRREEIDARIRRARALVVAERSLSERSLAASATFELATRARQAGVPAYAVSADDELNSFDARMLDLQVVLHAGSVRGLTLAGKRLGALLRRFSAGSPDTRR
jgi:hypothetical protein